MPDTNTIPSADLIERWEHCESVLNAMPEHERQKHWDMAQWGYKNDCGTIACAAGHCGLNPWFRERGFKLDFTITGTPKISDVPEFFGFEGSARIFHNGEQRSVETVLGEVRGYLHELRRTEVLNAEFKLPLGTELPQHGGHFAGFGFDDGSEYALIVGPEYDGYASWDTANAWAKGLSVAGHSDFVLPNRRESTGLFDRVRSMFQPCWYWTSEQLEVSADYAWYQGFGNDAQGWNGKDYIIRARAVRRVPIQSFGNSIISETVRS